MYFKLIRLSSLNNEIFHVKMLINEEIVPLPHYLVVNQFNVDGFGWIIKILMVYGCIGNIRRLRMFIKYWDKPREDIFII